MACLTACIHQVKLVATPKGLEIDQAFISNTELQKIIPLLAPILILWIGTIKSFKVKAGLATDTAWLPSCLCVTYCGVMHCLA